MNSSVEEMVDGPSSSLLGDAIASSGAESKRTENRI